MSNMMEEPFARTPFARTAATSDETRQTSVTRIHRSERNPQRSFGERLRQSFGEAADGAPDDLMRLAREIDAKRERLSRRKG